MAGSDPRPPLSARGIEREVEDELRAHIELRAEKLIAAGMPPAQARREAQRRFGDLKEFRAACVDIDRSREMKMGFVEALESLFRDLRDGLRSLRRDPGFAAAMIATIALGVGANTAVFSVVDAVLLRPLPYEAPDRLVTVRHHDVDNDRTARLMRPARARQWERAAPAFAELVLYGRVGFVRTDGADPVSVSGYAVSPDWLETLGVEPALGRTFTPDDARPGAPRTLIVSDPFWREQLGSDPEAIGATIRLDGEPYTLIGVMPRGFEFPPTRRIDLWVPLARDDTGGGEPIRAVEIVARLPAGMDTIAAQQGFDATTAALERDVPDDAGWAVRLGPVDEFRANTDVRQSLWMVTAAAGLLLLIAMVNASNLLVVRGISRRDETAIRLALGASRWRVTQRLLAESLVLVAIGGVVAVGMARALLTVVTGLLPSEITFFLTGEVALDRRVLLFALAITGFAGVAATLWPALRTARRTSPTTIAGARASSDRSAGRTRDILVVAEIALAVTLLVGAGLLVNSFLRLTSVDPGYEAERLVQLTVDLREERIPGEAGRLDFLTRLRARIGALPGVERTSLAFGLPPGNGSFTFGVEPQAEGNAPKPIGDLLIPWIEVEPGFFETLGVPIVAGRDFNRSDTRETGAVIIDRDTARFLWDEEHPVGRRFRLGADHPRGWLTVVGVIDDLKLWGRDDRQASYDLFFPLNREQLPSYISAVVRSAGDPEELLGPIRNVVRELAPELPLAMLATGPAALAENVDEPRFFLILMASFAAVALALAAVGTYGVLAFNVRCRHRELGIRAALGASAGDILAMVMRHGVALAVAGATLGVAGALLMGRIVESLLFGVTARDPATLAVVTVTMVLCAVLAAWLPALRATRVEPVQVLADE